MAAPTPTTPKRSRNTNISNSLVNPTKKDALCGYILYQSPLLNKGQFSQYTVQIQTDRDHSERMFGFNTKSYRQLKGFLDTGARVKMEVRRNQENNNIVFGSYCQCFPATTSEVDFSINSSLKEEIKPKSVCTTLTIAALKKTEPNNNLLYTIKASLLPLETMIPMRYIQLTDVKKLSATYVLSGSSGNVNFQVFTNKLQLFENHKSYQISHVKLNKFRGNMHVGLTYDSQVEEIQQISNAVKKEQLKTVTVDRFASIRNVQVVYQCRSCKKDINILTNEEDETMEEIMEEDQTMENNNNKKLEKVQCSNAKCGARSLVWKLKIRSTAEVNVDLDNDNDIWLTILHKDLFPLLPKKRTYNCDDVEKVLETLEDFKVVYDSERLVVQQIKLPSATTEMSSTSNSVKRK